MQYLSNDDFRVRSFVRRDSRMRSPHEIAYAAKWPLFGLSLLDGMLELDAVFGRCAPCYVEIGFGTGQSLCELAKTHPEANFIGIETYKPGIGSLLYAMDRQGVSNIRIYHADAIDVLTTCIPDAALAGVHIFFPDPWPKRRHYERRLVQLSLLSLLFRKIKESGSLHLATDWEDYAQHMQAVMRQSAFVNCFPNDSFSEMRSTFRPVITKFEQRAINEGRQIRELQYLRPSIDIR